LDGVVLGLLVERPGYGYALRKRLDERLGPGWQLSSGAIYAVLDRLAERGSVRSEQRELRGRPRSRERFLYSLTPNGVAEFERWLASPVRGEPVRPDVLARIAVARPEHAPLLVAALDGYEAECLDLLAAANRHGLGAIDPWDALIAEGVRKSMLEHVRAELAWVRSLRRGISEFDRLARE
jgi:DNA-binding PadR family transcriptional regulator